MDKTCDCMVVTWFGPNITGYLDFSYRVQAILRNSNATIVSNKPEARDELGVPEERFIYVPSNGNGVLMKLLYMIKLYIIALKLKPRVTVFLSSFFALFAWLWVPSSYSLYWNEHPSHAFPYGRHLSCFRRIKNALFREFCFWSALRANPVMPIGEYQQEELIKKGCRPEKICMVYMGVGHFFLNNNKDKLFSTQDDAVLNLLYTGTVRPERGRDIMLEAVAAVNKKKTRFFLTLVGANTEQQAICKKKVHELGIIDSVKIVGRVSGCEIPKFLHNADIGLCLWEDRPHWRFNPPTKLFEYMVAGLPILASDIQTHSYYVHNWENGVLFPYSVSGLTEALELIWQSRERMIEMRINVQKSGQKFLWEDIEPHFLKAIGL